MMAEIPPGAFQIPEYAIWMIGGWVLSSLISIYGGYRWGLCSQKEAAKLSARNAVFSYIDRIHADLWDNRSLWGDESKSKTELKKVTIEFSSQFPEAHRVRIKKALDNYEKLYIRYFEWPKKGTPEREIFDKEYKAMVDGLKNLRDEISDT
jgi:hypothetical protein